MDFAIEFVPEFKIQWLEGLLISNPPWILDGVLSHALSWEDECLDPV